MIAPATAQRHLFVVDLASSRFARPMVARAAGAAIRAAGSDGLVLLVGDARGLGMHANGTLVRSSDVVQAHAIEEAHKWIEATARDVVLGTGRSIFPEYAGVHFGEYSLLDIQSMLEEFALLAASMVSLLESEPIARCSIFTGDSQRARALARLADAYCRHVAAWSVPLLHMAQWIVDVGLAVRGAGKAVRGKTAAAVPPLPKVPPARVLTVSETLPMAQMFAAVEQKLREMGVGPVSRVQFGGTPQVTREGDTTIVTLGRGGVVAPRRRGRFAGHWRRIARRAEALDISAPYGRGRLRAPLFRILQYLHRDHFDRLAEQLDLANGILDEARPELLFVGNDRWWVEYAFVLAARQRGVPSLLLLDGVTSDLAEWWWATADRVAAWGEEWAAQLRRHGMPAERVRITGQPRYDPLAAGRSLEQVAAARTELGLRHDDFVVLFAAQPAHSPAVIEEVVDAILLVPGARVLLRPKPGTAANVSISLAARHGDRAVACATAPITTLLRACDLVVTEYSTVGVEAAILGVPLVTFTLGARPTPLSYERLGLADNARTAAELTTAVTRTKAEGAGRATMLDARRRAVEHLCGPVDGRASERVAALVAEMLETEQSRRR